MILGNQLRSEEGRELCGIEPIMLIIRDSTK
jgi:hypothetical protein